MNELTAIFCSIADQFKRSNIDIRNRYNLDNVYSFDMYIKRDRRTNKSQRMRSAVYVVRAIVTDNPLTLTLTVNQTYPSGKNVVYVCFDLNDPKFVENITEQIDQFLDGKL